MLPHRVIAQVVGARRPTVSTALTRLAQEGAVHRLADGTWLLPGRPVGLPTPEASRVVRLRAPRRARSARVSTGRRAAARGA